MENHASAKRYADPQRCPDCGAPIGYGASACAACSLSLVGPVAQELFTTLARADELLLRLRRAASAAPSAAAPAVDSAKASVAPAGPAGVTAPASSVAMKASSVPKVLLTLGAGCLLVAAMVFLAVAWSVMGVGGRTATLVGITVVCGGLTLLVARRSLRGATEALGLVSLGLLTLDVVGAEDAGWFGDIGGSSFAVLLGVIMASTSAAACGVLRRTPSGAFTSGEVVAVLGVALTCTGVVAGGWGAPEARLVVATVLALIAAWAARVVRLVVTAVGTGMVGGVLWAGLALAAIGRLGDHPSVAELWGDLQVWPALAAAALAAVPLLLRTVPLPLRQAAASVAAGLVTLAAIAPVFDESETYVSLTVLGVLAAAGAVLLVLPKPWSASALLTAGVAAFGTSGLVLVFGGVAAARLLEAAGDQGAFLDRLGPWGSDLSIEPWLFPLAVGALALAVVAAGRFVGIDLPWRRLLPFIAVSTAFVTAAGYPLPVWIFVAVGLLAGGVYVVRREVAFAIPALAVATVVALHSDGLTALALGALVAAGGWLVVRDDREPVQLVAGVVAQLAAAGFVWVGADLVGRPFEWAAAIGIVVVAVLAISGRRLGLELGAVVATACLAVAGLGEVPLDDEATWTAVYLTLAGAACVTQSLLRGDRRRVGWAGGLLLAMATWVRLADLGVNEPEPYTVPTALALLVVGGWQLRRRPELGTMPALAPGLGLALVPSLLWVLADPTTARSVLLGLVCLGLVVVGVQLRWTAPLVVAGAVGSLVVLRHAAPYVSGVERWMLIGFAGALLVTMGVTWEARVREARSALGYVRGMR